MTAPDAAPGRGEPEVSRLSMMRRAMARRMTEAAAVPCFYLRVAADVTGLVAERERVRGTGPGPTPSLNDAIVRAAALELRRCPRVNASFVDGELHVHPRVNVGVAIAIDDGLVVPAVYDADGLDAAAVGVAVRALAEAARARALGREVLEDATFTISNLGMFGIADFDPVLNPPQAAILGVGAAAEDPARPGRRTLRLTLGCDHRVLTGAEGADFLGGVRARLEAGGLIEPAAEPAGSAA